MKEYRMLTRSKHVRSIPEELHSDCLDIHHVVFHVAALLDHEVSGPYDERHAVVHAYEFSLSGAFRV